MERQIKAALNFNGEEWAVTWDAATATREYMISQFVFEARRAAERALPAWSPDPHDTTPDTLTVEAAADHLAEKL